MSERPLVDAGRLVVSFYPVALAVEFVEQTDTSWFFHLFLITFGAILPLAAIGGLASLVALPRRRPRPIYLAMASGWVLVGGTLALLAWAAGARSTVPASGKTGSPPDWSGA